MTDYNELMNRLFLFLLDKWRNQMPRKDNRGYVLHSGEYQRADGRYCFAYTDRTGKRHQIYSKTLVGMRERKKKLLRDYEDGLDPHKAGTIEVSHMVDSYLATKYDLKVSTRGAYRNSAKYIDEGIGKCKIVDIKYSDIKRFYYGLMIDKGLKATTVDHVNTVLHPAFQMAVRDGLIRTNPTEGVMNEIKHSRYWIKEKRFALSIPEQKQFMDFLRSSSKYHGWLPIFTVLLGTGMRIGECLGLTWDDLDFEKRIISVNHSLSDRPDEEGDCRKRIETTTKTAAGMRTIPMVQEVFDAFLMEYEFQKIIGFCEEEVDGYSGFVFSTGSRTVQMAGAVNRALHSIISDANKLEERLAKQEHREPIMIPQISAHNLRHTFCTRLCENESNLKVIQSIMGHHDISTTMDIYAECTGEKKQEVMANLEGKIII